MKLRSIVFGAIFSGIIYFCEEFLRMGGLNNKMACNLFFVLLITSILFCFLHFDREYEYENAFKDINKRLEFLENL